MPDTPLIVDQQQPIVTISLNNPPMNPIGIAQVEALEELLPRLAADNAVRVLVIRGAAGKNFSVGANLKEGHVAFEVGPKKFVEQRLRLFNAIEALEKPVIAAIQGYCLGGGLELAMACHFRIAEDTAQLALPEIDLGAAPLWGGASRLLRLVGRSQALEMLLRGKRISAERALQLNLVSEVLSPADFDAGVDRLATELASKAPLSTAAIIRLINCSQDLPLPRALDLELDTFSPLAGTKDNIEGVSALFEKREPKFTGE